MSKKRKKSRSFYDTYPKNYIKKLFKRCSLFFILKHFDWLIHDDMEFVLFLEGPFLIEIFCNEYDIKRLVMTKLETLKNTN